MRSLRKRNGFFEPREVGGVGMLVGSAALAAPRSPVVTVIASTPSTRSFRPAFFLREIAPALIERGILRGEPRARFERSARLDVISNAHLIALGMEWGVFESAAEFWREHKTRGELIEALYWAQESRRSRGISAAGSDNGGGGRPSRRHRGDKGRMATGDGAGGDEMGRVSRRPSMVLFPPPKPAVEDDGSDPRVPVTAAADAADEISAPSVDVLSSDAVKHVLTRAEEYERARAKRAAAAAAAAAKAAEDLLGVHEFMERHEHFTLPLRVGGPVNRCGAARAQRRSSS